MEGLANCNWEIKPEETDVIVTGITRKSFRLKKEEFATMTDEEILEFVSNAFQDNGLDTSNLSDEKILSALR